MCWLLWWVGYPYVARSWSVLEASRETSGIPAIFLLKTFIQLFDATLALQGIAMAIRCAIAIVDPSPPGDPSPGDTPQRGG